MKLKSILPLKEKHNSTSNYQLSGAQNSSCNGRVADPKRNQQALHQLQQQNH